MILSPPPLQLPGRPVGPCRQPARRVCCPARADPRGCVRHPDWRPGPREPGGPGSCTVSHAPQPQLTALCSGDPHQVQQMEHDGGHVSAPAGGGGSRARCAGITSSSAGRVLTCVLPGLLNTCRTATGSSMCGVVPEGANVTPTELPPCPGDASPSPSPELSPSPDVSGRTRSPQPAPGSHPHWAAGTSSSDNISNGFSSSNSDSKQRQQAAPRLPHTG